MKQIAIAIIAGFVAMAASGLMTTASSAETGGGVAAAAKKKCGKKGKKAASAAKKGKCKKKKKPATKPTPIPAPAPALLTVSPTAYTYPNAPIGGECFAPSSPGCPGQTFTVTNIGGTPSGDVGQSTITALSNPSVQPGFKFVAGGTCGQVIGTVPPGGSCTLTVVFQPVQLGTYTATLNVAGSPGGPAQASLAGTGVPQE